MSCFNRLAGVAALAAAVFFSGACGALADDGAASVFETKVRPVLAAHCFECHGDDKQESGLQLTSVAALLRGGDQGPAIVPGDADASLLVKAVRYDDDDLQMPPRGKLMQADIDALIEWIADGAPATKLQADRSTAGRRD